LLGPQQAGHNAGYYTIQTNNSNSWITWLIYKRHQRPIHPRH